MGEDWTYIGRRRFFLLSSSAALVSTSAPQQANADIIIFGIAFTVYEVLALLFAAIGVVWSAVSNAAIRDGLNDINNKLDTIIRNQTAIINEIESLKLYISQALFEAFKTDAEAQIGGYWFDYRTLMTEGWRTYGENQALNLAQNIESSVGKASLYGFSTCVAMLTGVCMALSIRRLMGRPTSEIDIQKALYLDVLKNWLDQNNSETGIPAAIVLTNKSISELMATLPAPPGPWAYPDNTYDQIGTREICVLTDGWRVYGSFQDGYTAQRENLKTDCHPTDIGYGGRDLSASLPAGITVPLTATPKVMKPDYSGIPTSAPPTSPDPLVNQMNKTRSDIIALQKHGRDLAFYLTTIQDGVNKLA